MTFLSEIKNFCFKIRQYFNIWVKLAISWLLSFVLAKGGYFEQSYTPFDYIVSSFCQFDLILGTNIVGVVVLVQNVKTNSNLQVAID